jgi:predicted oxidoreductase
MFVYLFGAVVEFVGFSLLAVIVYQVLLSDILKNLRAKNAERSSAKENSGKIALVKMVSDDPKDIEKFISANAQYLSDETVKKLVERIEMIKCDRIINEDSVKKRIDVLDIQEQAAIAAAASLAQNKSNAEDVVDEVVGDVAIKRTRRK